MKQFLLSERFKLEIKWDDVIYEQPGVCRFINARFSGPALQIAQKINDIDHILLDFYSQYIVLVKGVFVAKFDWSGLEYTETERVIYLKNATLSHPTELNNVPILKRTDYFVVDTSDHTPAKHGQNLVYKTYLINQDNSLYRFDK